MAKKRNLINNNSYNFKLRRWPSFFIGSFFILGTVCIQTIIKGFTLGSSPFSFLTAEFLELFIFLITLFVFILSLTVLFFSNRKYQRKIGNKIWNSNTRKSIWLLSCLICILYCIEFHLLRIGEEIFIIPTFIISYGLLLSILNFSRKKMLYMFSIVSILVGFIPLFIEETGFYALIVLGIAHFIFAYQSNTINDF